MSKISVIIQREYMQVVRKKSFLVMTLLGPVLLAALVIVPALVSMYGTQKTTIAVLDESRLFSKLNSPNDRDISYIYVKNDLEELKNDLIEEKYTALLYIPSNESTFGGMVYSSSSLGRGVMSNILASMKRNFSDNVLIYEFGIHKDSLDRYINQHINRINVGYTYINKDGKEEAKASHTRQIQFFVGLAAGILIYMFIFMYGSMVLRGVLEEKTNRIVEVMVSSVKPIQLMIGKIIGVVLIGLTQIVLWIVLGGGIIAVFMVANPNLTSTSEAEKAAILNQVQNNYYVYGAASENMEALASIQEGNSFLEVMQGIDFQSLIILFLFYFVAGYFLYATLYAAVGAAVDNDTDTQQFLLPLTIPLLLSIILSTSIAENPNGQVAFWLSMIPFTSPIAMLVRIPAAEAIQAWEILLSASLLILTCMLTAWMSAKIYRTGILMYGKKITYKELWKWLRYSN
jgi:ABC-2 type transport system permease protein